MGYDASNIRVLDSSVEAIRLRPSLYIGPLDDPMRFNRLIQEALCIAADEAMSGYCTEVRVAVQPEGTVIVRDNGRGLPMTLDQAGQPFAELLLTQLFACREHKQNEQLTGQCCQSGLVAVNALSTWLCIRNFREGACWIQNYDHGMPVGPFRNESATTESGVELAFRLDSTILGPLVFDGPRLANWFADLGLRIGSFQIEDGTAAVGWPATLLFERISPQRQTDG